MTRDRSVLYAAAVVAALLVGPHGLLYWDSFGYVAQALSGHPGGLMLGRPLFVLVSHLVAMAWKFSGGSVWHLEPVLRVFWLLVSASTAPAAYTLARECGLGVRGSRMAGLAAALSPALANTSDAVLTDAPSTALAAWAMAMGARAAKGERAAGWWGAVAGIALGAAFGLREQAVFGAASLALLVVATPREKRAGMAGAMAVGAVVAGALPVLWAAATQRGYLEGVVAWVRAMQRERAGRAYGLRDFGMYCVWLVTLGPLALWWAGRAWVRKRGVLWKCGGVVMAVCVPSLVQLGGLAVYQDIAFSPRYLLPAWVGAACVPAGVWWESSEGVERSWKKGMAGMVLSLMVLGGGMWWAQRGLRGVVDGARERMAGVPSGSVVVTGQMCPAVELVERLERAEMGERGRRWQRVCPGWGWPGGELGAVLERARGEGRVVVLDLREEGWPGVGQRESREEVRRWRDGHRAEEASGGVRVWE